MRELTRCAMCATCGLMLALALGLFARAIYVPSSARRSLLIGLAVAVPHLAVVASAPFRMASDPGQAEFFRRYVALVGELTGGQTTIKGTMKPAIGATIGRVVGTTSKVGIAIAMWLVLSVSAFWP